MKIREFIWPWFPVFWFGNILGITLYPLIIYKHRPRTWLRNHEWIHVDQVRRDGWLRFYWRYITSHYWRETYEREAYKYQSRPREVYE